LLADFGNSILVESTFTLTIDNTDGGSSFHWTATEIIEDCIPSTASDVWAFGMTILVSRTHVLLPLEIVHWLRQRH
ncbi:hypothetical protein EDD15DRAFT_2179813, partial [Pisolithus albus]